MDTCSVGWGVFTAVGASTTGLAPVADDAFGSMLSIWTQDTVAASRVRSPLAQRKSTSFTVTLSLRLRF